MKMTRLFFPFVVPFDKLRIKSSQRPYLPAGALAEAGSNHDPSIHSLRSLLRTNGLVSTGFTLIELLISSAIAAMLTGLLFFAFSQTSKLLPKLDSYDDVYSKATLLNAQLERDLSGAFVPNEYYVRKKKEKDAAAEKKEKEADEQSKKKAAQQNSDQEEKKEQKPLEKLFYGVGKDGTLDYLTFITDNPLAIYWSSKTGAPRPRAVRVVYRLKEEKGKNVAKGKKSYQLVRQESQNLEMSAFDEGKKEVREYVIADGIKDMKVSYRAFVEQKPEDAKAEQKKESQKKELRTFTEWVRKTEEDTESKEIVPLIPQLTYVKISFWDYQKKRAFPFDFIVYNRAEFPLTRKEQAGGGSRLVKMISDNAKWMIPPPQPAAPGLPISLRPPIAGVRRS